MNLEKRILFSASLFHGLNDAATVAIPMVFPLLYAQKFIIMSYSHIGILSHLGLLTTLLFQILIVHYADRFEYKTMLLTSFLGICATLILITFSKNFFYLLISYLLFRVFDSFYHTLGLARVARMHPSQAIDFAMGVQSGSGNFGVFLAFISVGFLAQRFGWKSPLFFWAAACFVLGVVSFAVIRSFSSKKEEQESVSFSSWLETLRKIKRYAPGFVFGGASWGTTVYFAPSLLNHKFGIPLGKTGLFLALWIGIGTLTTYSFGFLSKRYGRFRIARIGLAGSVVSIFILGAASRPWMAVAGLLLFGAFLFLIYPAFQSCVGNRAPANSQNQAFSLVSNLQLLAGAVFALVFGFIADRFGIHFPFLLMSGFGLLILIFYAVKPTERL